MGRGAVREALWLLMNILALEEHEAEAPAGPGLERLRALRAQALGILLGLLGAGREELSPRWCHLKHALLAAEHAYELAGMLAGADPGLSERALELFSDAIALAEELLRRERHISLEAPAQADGQG
jgi:hypothetical protein